MFKITLAERDTDLQPSADKGSEPETERFESSDFWAHLPQAGFPLSYSTPGHGSMGW